MFHGGRQIIALYFSRDDRAIRETEAAYGGRLLTLSRRILNSREDAQECVNDTYWQTWNSIPAGAGLGSCMHSWQPSAAHLSLNPAGLAQRAKRSGCMVELTAELENCIPARMQDPAARIALKDALEQFLGGLKQEERLIFLRRYLYLEPIAQLAQEFGISQSKCKTLLYRLRNKLRLHLEKEGIAV